MHAPIRTRRTAGVVLALCLALALCVAGLAAGAPAEPQAPDVADDVQAVTLNQGIRTIPTNGTLTLQATISVDRPTSYLEARLQVRTPGGALLYQKTEIRSDLETGTLSVSYTRQLEDLGLEPGIYPIVLRVRTQSDTVREWVAEDRLLLHAPTPPRVPVAIVAYVCAAPSIDPDGRFVIDPATSIRARDDARHVAQSILSHPAQRLTLALPGYLLEEWLRAAGGYEIVSPEGVREVPETAAGATEYARALDTLRQAVDTGRLEIATVPYGVPDIGALQSADRLDDLDAHILRGRSASFSVLGGESSRILVIPGGLLPASALDIITERDLDAAVVSPGSLASTDTPAPSGTYNVGGAGFTALVADPESSSLGSDEATGFVTAVFERALSTEASMPIVTLITLGPGQTADAVSLTDNLRGLTSTPWLELITATQAASRPVGGLTKLAETVEPLSGAPTGYWKDIHESRKFASAFLDTVGVNDPEAQRASDLSLMAQSASWAGPDANWGSAERGRSLAAAAQRTAAAVLDAIELGASEITLSGTGGEVPISIMNSSDKNLTLKIRTRASGLNVDESMNATQQVRPQENFVTVPVDLGQSLSGRLTVQVYAGDILLDDVTVTVRASILDRLVLILGVAVVLVGMLLFIRRRIRNADVAGTMRDGERHPAGS